MKNKNILPEAKFWVVEKDRHIIGIFYADDKLKEFLSSYSLLPKKQIAADAFELTPAIRKAIKNGLYAIGATQQGDLAVTSFQRLKDDLII